MSKQIDLLDKSISPRKIVWTLAWPAVVEQMLMTIVTYVDAAMVGSAGVTATAAVGVNTSVIWMLQGLMAGLGVGASVLVAKKIGEGNAEEAKAFLRQAIVAMTCLGLILTLIGQLILTPYLAKWMGAEENLIAPAQMYMRIVSAAFLFQVFLGVGGSIIRGTGDTRSPMVYNVISNVVNLIGNFLFIYPTRTISVLGLEFTMWGAGMGVGGAALGTSLAFIVAGSITMFHLFSRRRPFSVSLKEDFRPNRDHLDQMIRLALPSTFERVTLSAGQMLITALVTGMGSSVLAAHQLANTAESICYMPVFGFNVAVTTLVAQALGAGEKQMAKEYGNLCLKYGFLIMIGCAIAMYAMAPQMIALFIDDAAVIATGAAMLRIEALAEPALAIATVAPGILRGAGDTKWPFYISIIGMWMVRMTLAVFCIKVLGMGLEGIWIPMALDWFTRAIISMWRIRGGKWLNIWDRTHPSKTENV